MLLLHVDFSYRCTYVLSCQPTTSSRHRGNLAKEGRGGGEERTEAGAIRNMRSSHHSLHVSFSDEGSGQISVRLPLEDHLHHRVFMRF